MSKLIWTATGDTIDLVVDNHEVYDYFLTNINASNTNRYHLVDFDYKSIRDELLDKFQQLQSFFRTKLRDNTFEFDIDPSNQQDLNHLHRTWVKYHQKYPNIGKLFDQQILSRINKLIHAIEELSQEFLISTDKPEYCFENIFGVGILQHGIFNLSVEFNNLGRYTFNKWVNGDNVEDTDTNNFKDFYTTLKICVRPPELFPLPIEYQNWCKKLNIDCVGSQLPLANFDNIDNNLLKYRQLVLRNSLVENNFIILE